RAARTELFASARPLANGQTATPRLPIPSTSFVGRSQELAEVRQLLLTTRLLTLTGAGGSGKTRLALEAARASIEQFSDGVTVVLLGAIADADLVLPASAAALGVQEVPDRHLSESVIAYLRRRNMLLLVDNFEHLLGGAIVITDVLESCPNVSA